MGDRMRFDRNHLAVSADTTGQHHGIGTDIGADIDEYAACGSMRAQKIQLFEIVMGIEQRAALGGAGLMVKPKRCALIVDVDRSSAQQIDQPRQPGTKRAALQPRAMRKADNRSLRGIRGERAERRGYRIVVGCQTMVLGGSSACIVALFCHCERSEAIHGAKEKMVASAPRNDGGESSPHTVVIPAKAGIQYAAAYRINHCCLGILVHPPSRVMTAEYGFAISRLTAPEFCKFIRPQREGAGKTGCTLHPRSHVQDAQSKTHTSIQVQRRHSGLPCAMVLRLISCSPR